ncbi:hypothetical protein FOQG_16470 [Fusarium oxysporum f. sp. raphani 54005]|uniref:Uncharacterized protein n=1 Tax=Fusarium oxysporum f. sp. raphani 54005 TaxID=1089458 RepID=X0BAU0_FUSOX|nr:hypothetical protein FOQG_16470 [Fusarium oxysporum f. sp. raphani 54005]
MARQFNNMPDDSWPWLLNFDNTTNARPIGSAIPTALESAKDKDRRCKDTITRLIKIETMLKWIYDNQIKLLEKYIGIEQRIEAMRKSLEEQGGCIKDSLGHILANSGSR